MDGPQKGGVVNGEGCVEIHPHSYVFILPVHPETRRGKGGTPHEEPNSPVYDKTHREEYKGRR